MAQIPQIITSPSDVPSTGGSQVRADPRMDIPTPPDPSQAQAAGAQLEAQSFQSVARSNEKLAAYGEQFADQYIKAKLNVDAADRTADLSKQLHEAEFQSSKIADRTAATADFDARAAKIRDEFAAQDVNPRVRAAVDANLPNQIALRRASTQNAAFGLESKDQVAKLIGNIDQYNKQAVDATDPRLTEQLIQQANDAIDGRVAGGWLAADVAAKMKVDFGSNVYRTKIEVAMQKDMRTGLALYQATAGKLNAADARAMGVMAADRTKQVDAETAVSTGMPVFGQSSGGDIGAVRADAEKTLGFPLTITSADRDPAHNAAVGGATGSQHLTPGKALDISLAGLSDEQQAKVINQFMSDPRVGGIGFYADHLHVDARSGPKATWGKPPAALAETVGIWQSTATAAPSGDQLSQYKIDAYRYRQSIIDDLTMDPEVKARRISIIDQRLGTTNAIVLEQRKSAADAAEKAGIDLYTGTYKAGTFQQVADQFRATGDSSSAAVYDVMARNESQLIEDAKNPPAKESIAARLLPGAAGRIAAQNSALARADIADARAMAVQQRSENRRLGSEQEKLFNDGLNSDISPEALIANARDAYQYYRAAGDLAKAESIRQQLEGSLEGALKAKLPPAEREKLKLEFQQRAADSKGLSVEEAAVAKQLAKGEEANRQRWETDALSATNDIGRIRLQPFDINKSAAELQLWAVQRTSDLGVATWSKDPRRDQPAEQFFHHRRGERHHPEARRHAAQEAQQFLAKLAAAVPEQAIALIGNQLAKKDVATDSYAAALGLYKRNQPGDKEIGDRIITGMKWLTQGGPDGKTRLGDHKLLQQTIDDRLVKARSGMTPEAVALQNNAIQADYVALTAGDPNRTDITTKAMDQAILDVVGKTTTHNGVTTIIPREIEPYQFRNGWAAINQDDVAHLKPTEQGQPITAEVVRQNGQPVPAGDGKYNVVIPDPLRAGRTTQLIDSNTGKPWVVDIKPLIARGVRGEGTADQPDPLRQGQVTTPTPQPLVTKPVRRQPGGGAP